jgi:hypothetical protein
MLMTRIGIFGKLFSDIIGPDGEGNWFGTIDGKACQKLGCSKPF